MGKRKYDWKIGSPPPPLEEHSFAKHAVFRSYVQRYIEILTSDPRHDGLKLSLVDGFAGGGEYRYQGQIKPGSPLILLDEVACARARFATTRTKSFALEAEFFFVEHHRPNIAYLDNAIRQTPHGAEIGKTINLLNASFDNALPGIIAQIQTRGTSHRSLFFLDQYGYGDVPFALIRAILQQLKNPEIILTFTVDYIIDYLSTDDAFLKAVIPVELTVEQVREMMAIRTNGGREGRWVVQNLLYRHLQERTGAPFYTCFFIKAPKSHRSYWLVHISKHPRARDEMATRHWALKNHFVHHGGPGTNMLGYDPGQSLDQLPLDFLFDDDADARSKAALIQQLPPKIFNHDRVADGGISLGSLFTEICNTTPATIDLVSSTLVRLRAEGEVQILTKDGKERPRSSTCDWTDIILPARQRSLFSSVWPSAGK